MAASVNVNHDKLRKLFIALSNGQTHVTKCRAVCVDVDGDRVRMTGGEISCEFMSNYINTEHEVQIAFLIELNHSLGWPSYHLCARKISGPGCPRRCKPAARCRPLGRRPR